MPKVAVIFLFANKKEHYLTFLIIKIDQTTKFRLTISRYNG